MQRVAVFGREALNCDHCQATHPDEDSVEKNYEWVVDQVAVHEPVRHESSVVPVDDGGEYRLLEAVVKVPPQSVNL